MLYVFLLFIPKKIDLFLYKTNLKLLDTDATFN